MPTRSAKKYFHGLHRCLFLNTGKNALDIAKVFADSRIIDLLQNKLDNLPNVTEKKGAEKGTVAKPKMPSAPTPSEVQAVKTEV